MQDQARSDKGVLFWCIFFSSFSDCEVRVIYCGETTHATCTDCHCATPESYMCQQIAQIFILLATCIMHLLNDPDRRSSGLWEQAKEHCSQKVQGFLSITINALPCSRLTYIVVLTKLGYSTASTFFSSFSLSRFPLICTCMGKQNTCSCSPESFTSDRTTMKCNRNVRTTTPRARYLINNAADMHYIVRLLPEPNNTLISHARI